jgi:subtilisin family serine protease
VPIPVWIEFVDRAPGEPLRAAALVSERSLRRRSKVLPAPFVTADDQPLAASRLAAVRRCGVRLRHTSRWLNAASALATPEAISRLCRLDGVRSVELVARFGRRPRPVDRPHRDESIAGPGYGGAARQLEQVGADKLHDRGLYGLGVLVAHFDTGYERLSHEVYRTLRVAAAWDFVDGDDDPSDSHSIPDDLLDHGHQTLSVLAGFKPGKLVGVAPGSGYLLARTESSLFEVPVEEDHWIAALEWADSLGADIVSSSLKFLEYDLPWMGYTWRDMNGATARVTRAADMAGQRGMLIFNGAGNEGHNFEHNTLVAPADGFDVLAIGAVTSTGERADFSSVGPTTEARPRIKPDLMAPGVGVVAADVVHDSSYTRLAGTSLATPIAAGVAALLLSVHDATPAQIRDALRTTASQAVAPDNWMGWGVIDGEAAYRYLIALFPTGTDLVVVPGGSLRFANPFRPGGELVYASAIAGPVTLRIYDALGRRVRDLAAVGDAARAGRVTWDGNDDAGRRLACGVYFVQLQGGAPVPASSTGRKLLLVP